VWKALRRRLSLAGLIAFDWGLARLGRAPDYGILSLEIGGELSEDGHDGRLPSWLKRPPTDYLSLVAVLRWARDDDRLQAIAIRCGPLGAGWARIQGLRRSLLALRAAGKRVWVHLDGGGLPEYYLASAADRVAIAPAGTLDIVGLSSEAIFFLDALQMVGVRAEVVQIGAYKSAAESFTRRTMSEAHREMTEALVDDLYGQIVEEVAVSRGMDPAAVREAIDTGPFLAREALASGLVDAVEYVDETEAALESELGGAKSIDESDYAARRGRSIRRRMLRRPDRRIAIVHINGTIKMEEGASAIGRGRGAAAATLKRCLKDVRDRQDIEAVIVRIASPGGSGLASDLVWHELKLTAAQKPLIVSMGDVAASGGYYVALPGRRVFAEPGTVTGSIGVIAGKADLRGLYEKVGVRKEIVSRGRHAALYSDYAPLGDGERQRLHDEASAFYDDFVGKVAEGRSMSPEQVDTLARGRVWTGRQAWSRGLVDELGGFDEACDAAKLEIGIDVGAPVAVERFPQARGFWRTAFGRSVGGHWELLALPSLVREIPFLARDRVWLRLPFDFRIR
jgi:protease-4